MEPVQRGPASFALALAIALWSGPAASAETPPALLGAACSACHGPNGRSPGAIPSIDGLAPDVIRTSLLAFKRGQAPATIMDRIAKGFTDGEIDALATSLGRKGP